MQDAERKVAEAAASLTVKDLEWVQSHRMMPNEPELSENAPPSHESVSEQQDSTQEESSQKPDAAPEKRTRRSIRHAWPEVGVILRANYHGQHYEAEVVEAPQLKSGKALKILTGPAAGKVCRSVSRAMLRATEAQREANDLGRKGVANGWEFWRVKTG